MTIIISQLARTILKVAAAVMVFVYIGHGQTKELLFQPLSPQIEISNPERGFFIQRDTFPQKTEEECKNLNETGESCTRLSDDPLFTGLSPKITLISQLYYLDAFSPPGNSGKYIALTAAAVKLIQDDLTSTREAGRKIILRFAYDKDHKKGMSHKQTLAGIRSHLSQLKDILKDRWDVIAAFEVGLIGVYGENYFTSVNTKAECEIGGDCDHQYGDFGPTVYSCNSVKLDEFPKRVRLIADVLKIVPDDRFVLLRYPSIKIHLPGSIDGASIPVKRLGFFNDGFMATNSDSSTFCKAAGETCQPKEECGILQRDYLKNETLNVPLVGETYQENADYGKDRKKAREQLKKYHWSALNIIYDRKNLGAWVDGGFDQAKVIEEGIGPYLGYRFELQNGIVAWNQNAGSNLWTVTVSLPVKNVGSASPFNPRDLSFELEKCSLADEEACSKGNDYTFYRKVSLYEHGKTNSSATTNPQNWKVGVPFDLTAPFENVDPGIYRVLMGMPDPLIKNDPKYSIKIANQGIDFINGRNVLGIIKISK